MKHLKDRKKTSAARRIFSSLLSLSSGDETLRLLLDILRATLEDISFGGLRHTRGPRELQRRRSF